MHETTKPAVKNPEHIGDLSHLLKLDFGPRTLSEMARIMGRKGAKKGARKAGKARMAALTAKQRSDLARTAAQARWGKRKAGKPKKGA